MGGEFHVDAVPHIAPFGVMIEALGNDRNLGHEAEGFGEVGEHEAA